MNPRLAATAAAIAICLIALPTLAGQPQRFVLDGTQSAVSARVRFFGLASKTAQFPEVSGGVELDSDRPQAIDLDVTLNARALRAGDRETLARLKGPNFFDVERYPTVRFSGRSMRMTGARTADVAGELTARGVTRREVLRVTFDREPGSIAGNVAITISGTMAINRRDYGMTAYSLIVGNRVTITIRARMAPG